MPVVLPDGSAFFVAEVPRDPPRWGPIAPGLHEAIQWNPWNKVVQDHRDGTIHHDLTNAARGARGLATPWTPAMADVEVRQEPIP